MNIVIVGHVDHGKSTVIGRLLADAHALPKGKLEQVRQDCERNSKPFEYAFLLDALKDEQAQGITIDSARAFFKSKKREYIIIDAPGHIEFLKNMISGAARAEAALLVIDAKEGVRENSKRHGYLLSMLGIKQIAVCVNKMDLVGYKKSVFQKIEKEYREFLKKIGVKPKFFIPISAREGDNIVKASKRLKWFKGHSILSALDAFTKAKGLDEKPFRFPVQGVYKFTAFGDDRRIMAGRIESGTATVGDKVVFLPSNKQSMIESIENFNTPRKKTAKAGCSTGFTLKEEIYVTRGEIMCKTMEEKPVVSSLFRAEIFWMGRRPMVFNKDYKLKLGTAKVPVRLKKIEMVIDASDLKKSNKKEINRHDVAQCILECTNPIAFDTAGELEVTGRFVIVDQYDIAGGGVISKPVEDEQAGTRAQVVTREMNWDFSIVEPEKRSESYGHRPKLVLLTGIVGADKKVIAKELEKKLFNAGKKVYFLGIGNLLRGLNKDVERDRPSRAEHVRRLGEVAHIMMDAGLIVLATASNLNDEELRLLQTLTARESMVVVNVGKNNFKEDVIDLNLNAKDTPLKNAGKILKLLDSQNIFL